MENTDNLLEAMIDKRGLVGVLEAIAEICYLKAQHLEENWQDETAAKQWTWYAKCVERLAYRLSKGD